MSDGDGSGGGDAKAEGNGSDISTEDTMRERAGESRLKLWLLLGANRLHITGVLAAGVFVAFLLVGMFVYPPFPATVESSDVVETIFSTMLSALITGVTLVVTISQLVLSQENGPLADQRQRMSGAMDFRNYANEVVGHTTPSDPSAFLRSLVEETEERATDFADAVEGDEDLPDDLREEVSAFADSVTGNAETVKDQLDGARFGTFNVLFAALNYNYSWKIFHVDRFGDEYGDELTTEQRSLLSQLKSALALFGPAREHVKTLYFEWALVDLSQYILYAAIPAIVVAGSMLSFVGGGSFPGTTLGVANVLWVVDAAFTVTVVPFLLFAAYVLRIATVAKRTLAIGPLILRDSQR